MGQAPFSGMAFLHSPSALVRAAQGEGLQPVNPEISPGRSEKWASPLLTSLSQHFQESWYPKPDPSPLLAFRDASDFDLFCSHLLSHCTLTGKVGATSCSPLLAREAWGGHAPFQPRPSSQTFSPAAPSRAYHLQPGSKVFVRLRGPSSSLGGQHTHLAGLPFLLRPS